MGAAARGGTNGDTRRDREPPPAILWPRGLLLGPCVLSNCDDPSFRAPMASWSLASRTIHQNPTAMFFL